MANTTYYGSLGAAQALNYTVTVPLSGGSSISGARIDSVVAAAFMSTNAYGTTYQVRARLLNSVGATLAEVTRYDIKFDSGNYTGATWYFDFGTSVDVNSIASISYFGLNDASKIFAKSSQSVTVDYTTYTACGAPTWIGIGAAMAAPGEGVSLLWSGASDGAANPIIGYIVQRSENGGGWSNWATTGATSYTVYAHSTYGNYYDYRIVTDGQQIDSGASASVRLTTYTPIACGAPSAGLSASLAESAPNLNYSGASGGTINAITGYEILYADSADGSTWGGWNALRTVSNSGTSGSTTADLPATRGHYRKFAIRTQGSAGASYYSGWTYTGSVRYNSIPTAPTSFSASPAVYVSGSISLSYPGATDTDNNISTYNVQYATSADGVSWSGWTSLSDGAASHTPTLSPGHYIKYQARAVDALGVASGWTVSNQCGKNTAPAAPVITYPQNGETIHNSRPRFLLTIGDDPEYHTQSIAAAGYSASRSSGIEPANGGTNNLLTNAKIERTHINTSPGEIYDYYWAANLEPNTQYTLSGWYKADSICKGMEIIVYPPSNVMGDYHSFTYDFSVPYTFFSVTFATSLTAYGTYYIRVDHQGSTGGSSTLCYKEFKLSKSFESQPLWDYGKVILRKSEAASAGTVSISAVSTDQYAESSSAAARDTTYAAASFTDATIAKGTTAIKAAHMTELRGMINTVRAYYGMAAVVWAEAITAGVTKTRNWPEHIVEMRAAINDIVTLVNGWDTVSTLNRIPTFNWVTIRGRQPQADAVEQIRQVIAWL